MSSSSSKRSAGILLWKNDNGLRVLLVHPGGPFWARKDEGAWSIPKGEYEEGEEALSVARREFAEELGAQAHGEAMPLGDIRQKGGKLVTGFALEGDFEVAQLSSNTFELEWPPKSGRKRSFPEVDRAQWFSVEEARAKINRAQRELIDRLIHVRGEKR
jgi:predicted NUDIX family NTP pyrophosphohydrolase